MKSRIAEALRLPNEPVALVVTDDLPEGAACFQPGKQSCVMFLFASAAEGKTGALSREAYGCVGGGVGMGFGDCYRAFPGGHDMFVRFLSTGNGTFDAGDTLTRASYYSTRRVRVTSPDGKEFYFVRQTGEDRSTHDIWVSYRLD